MNTGSASKRVRLEVLLLLGILVVTVGSMVAPSLAGAASNQTSLTAKSLNATITWGGYTIVTGTLMDETTLTALGGQMLRVEWSLTGASPSWTLLATVTTDSAQFYTGQYAAVVYPRVLTYYRFNYLGGVGYDLASSNVLLIRVRPALSVPRVPTSAKVNQSFTVSGTLKPRFPAGAKTVTLKVIRYNGIKWVAYKTYKATNVNSGRYTKYSRSLKISRKGKYRFRASTAAVTAKYSAASTAYSKRLQVK